MALRKKVTDSKALKEFRVNLDVKIKQRYEYRPTGSKDIINQVSSTTLFGKGNRPETPIKSLICGEFGNSTE